MSWFHQGIDVFIVRNQTTQGRYERSPIFKCYMKVIFYIGRIYFLIYFPHFFFFYFVPPSDKRVLCKTSLEFGMFKLILVSCGKEISPEIIFHYSATETRKFNY